MSGQRDILLQSVDQMLRASLTASCRAAAEEHGWCDELWSACEALGLSSLLRAQENGGFGGDLEDGCAVARLVGQHAVPAPVMEDVLVAGLLAGRAFPGPSVPAFPKAVEWSGGRVTATAHSVPWGRFARQVLISTGDGQLILLPTAQAQVVPRTNLAGEPRDDLRFEGAIPLALLDDAPDPISTLVAFRVAQMAGALEAALDLSIDYANQRAQFGKPIGKFQAVQQQLAVMAEEVAAVVAASEALARAAAYGNVEFETAAAKLRANQAVEAAVAIAHQTFGAIGFTEEHGLRRFTQRLMAWRSEQGSDRFWAERLGAAVISRGASALWSDLTARTDALELEA